MKNLFKVLAVASAIVITICTILFKDNASIIRVLETNKQVIKETKQFYQTVSTGQETEMIKLTLWLSQSIDYLVSITLSTVSTVYLQTLEIHETTEDNYNLSSPLYIRIE